MSSSYRQTRRVRFRPRPYVPDDEPAVVMLSLRAWAPVFASMANVLGQELGRLLHGGDWRAFQEASVRATLADPDASAWVAESGNRVVAFVVAKIADADRRIGEVVMLAVDPDAQQHGLGTELTESATSWLRERGMAVAMIATGGDPGHAAARRTYEKASFTLMPSAQYFKAL